MSLLPGKPGYPHLSSGEDAKKETKEAFILDLVRRGKISKGKAADLISTRIKKSQKKTKEEASPTSINRQLKIMVLWGKIIRQVCLKC